MTFETKHPGGAMRAVRLLSARLAVVFGALLIGGCATIGKLNIISEPQELELGAQFATELEQQLEFVEDPAVIAYVDSLGQALAAVSRRNYIPYSFHVVDTDDVNAFAVPGGYLYVNRGLIEAADTESELAGVIGHEIGHIVGRHSARQMSQQIGLSILASAALGQDPDGVAAFVANIVATGTIMNYSRTMEAEADAYGVQELYDAGVDPGGLADFFDKLVEMRDGRGSSAIEHFFASHPDPGARAADVRAQVASLPAKPGLRADSPTFHAVQDRLAQEAKEGAKKATTKKKKKTR
jgi:predicted Zn-dependent protease